MVPELGLARLLQEKLGEVFTGTGEEDPQAEPNEVWWNGIGLANSFMLIDSCWNLQGHDGGQLRIRYTAAAGPQPVFRGLVEEVLDRGKEVIARWSGMIPLELRTGKIVTVPWARHDESLAPTPGLPMLKQALTGLFRNPLGRQFVPKLFGELVGIVHPSELSFGQNGDAWVFPLLVGPPDAFRAKATRQMKIYILPTLRGGVEDVGSRVPAVRHLRDKSIAVVGLGAVGAPTALELARNGCRSLRLLDHERVEPGNSIRWPLGSSAWGRPKLEALKEFVEAEYGWCSVLPVRHMIGDTTVGSGDDEQLAKLVDGTDLVVDCAASFSVTTALDDLCRGRGIPLISVWATPPVTGGGVVLYRAGGGCPTCLEHHHHDRGIARPPGFGVEDSLLQPAGCAERTFTGSSTDLQELSLEAARLCLRVTGDNPPPSSLIETLSLVDADDRGTPPGWRLEDLPIHPDCTCAH